MFLIVNLLKTDIIAPFRGFFHFYINFSCATEFSPILYIVERQSGDLRQNLREKVLILLLERQSKRSFMKEEVFGVETAKQRIISIVIRAIAAIVLFVIVIAAIVLTSMAAA